MTARLMACGDRGADSRGRTRALFTSSAGNSQAPVHVPGSLGLPNIVSLTYSDSSDVVRGNTGCAAQHPPFGRSQGPCHDGPEHVEAGDDGV